MPPPDEDKDRPHHEVVHDVGAETVFGVSSRSIRYIKKKEDKRMNGKRIIIIGATSGIGYEVARIYIERGYTVGLAGRRVERLEEFQASAPGRVHIKRLDVTAEDAPTRLKELIDETGGMDIFLLCAGIGKQNPALDSGIEQATLQTNVTGFTRMVVAAYQYFTRKGGGHIAVISSIAGTKGLGAAPSYSASKGFQNLYIDALAQLSRMERRPIAFTDIRPGFVRTDLLNDGKRYPALMSPAYVARQIARAIDRKKRRAIIDGRYALLVFLWRLIPAWLWERLPIRN